jgi:hypothetical protein
MFFSMVNYLGRKRLTGGRSRFRPFEGMVGWRQTESCCGVSFWDSKGILCQYSISLRPSKL